MPANREKQQRRILANSGIHRLERAEGDQLPTLEGYAALFNVTTDLGWFTEEIAPGAFTESLERGDDVVALIDHIRHLIVARTPDTLRLKEDDKGLFCSIDPINTNDGRDLVEKISRGVISQMSFGFYIDSETFFPADGKTRQRPHFVINKVSLFDVSAVTFPAYDETSIQVARSIDREDFEARMQRAISLNKSGVSEKEKRDREIQIKRWESTDF